MAASEALNNIVENVSIVLSIALVCASILAGGWMFGSATAHSNRVEHDRQILCLQNGGSIEYETKVGEVCKKR